MEDNWGKKITCFKLFLTVHVLSTDTTYFCLNVYNFPLHHPILQVHHSLWLSIYIELILCEAGYRLLVFRISRKFRECFLETHYEIQNARFTLSYFIQISRFINCLTAHVKNYVNATRGEFHHQLQNYINSVKILHGEVHHQL